MKILNLGLVCVACTATLIQADIYSAPIYSVARNSAYARAKRDAVREDRIAKSRANSHRQSEVGKERTRASKRIRYEESGQKRLQAPVGDAENDEEYSAAVGEGRIDNGRARYGSRVPEWVSSWIHRVFRSDVDQNLGLERTFICRRPRSWNPITGVESSSFHIR